MGKLLPFLMLSSAIDFSLEENTDNGIDKLQIMVKFISVLEADEKSVKKEYGKLKSWLYSQLKRKITNEEEIALLEGIGNYLNSDPATEERKSAMDYLFNAKFIN